MPVLVVSQIVLVPEAVKSLLVLVAGHQQLQPSTSGFSAAELDTSMLPVPLRCLLMMSNFGGEPSISTLKLAISR